jgi:hypothetical protein
MKLKNGDRTANDMNHLNIIECKLRCVVMGIVYELVSRDDK